MKRLIVFLLLASPAFAALSVNTIWEVRPTVGNDTNGGGFVTGSSGTDMSQFNNKNAASCTGCQSATANISTTDAVTNGTTTITSATAAFSAAIVGNIINLSGGTGSIVSAWYQVVTFTNSTTIVLDRSTGLTTGTGATMNIGGALATLGQANTNAVASNTIYIAATGTNGITAGITITAGSTITGPTQVIGYTSSRTDNGFATVQITSGTGITALTVPADVYVKNLIVDCNSTATSTGFLTSGAVSQLINVQAKNCGTVGIKLNVISLCWRCYASASATGITLNAAPATCIDCTAHANTAAGFSITSNAICIRCISDNNTGATTDGFALTNASGASISSSIAYKNGRDGIRISSPGVTSRILVDNTISYGNTGKSINDSTAETFSGISMNYNAYVSGSLSGLSGLSGPNDVLITGDPFTNGTTGDFSLNNTAGAGAALKGAGFPGVTNNGASTGHLSIGTIEPAAGGGQTNTAYVQ